MVNDEIEGNISKLNAEICDLESSKKIQNYLFEPSIPKKSFLYKSIKPNFFLIKNGIVTLVKVLGVSVVVFLTVEFNIELTLKISVIILLLFLTYDYNIKYSKELKIFKKNEEFDLKQSIKFEEETKIYNQRIKKYYDNKIENDIILKFNSEIEEKIKIKKSEVDIHLANLEKNLDKSNSITEIIGTQLFDKNDLIKSHSNTGLNYHANENSIKKDQGNIKITCRNCQHKETVNLGLIVKIIGGALPIGGFWAWTTYLLAGTGLALPIVMAMIGGGIGMLLFKDNIVKWILEKKYKCPECGNIDWQV